MHVCTVVPAYLPNFGGAEVGLHMVLSYLAQTTSHRFSVITPTTDPEWPRQEIMDGVEIYRYHRPDIWANWFAPTLASFLHNPPLIRQLSPDVLHPSYLLPSGISAWYTAKRKKLPLVLSLGGNDVYDPFNMPPALLRRWMRYCIQNTPIIAANSAWTKQYIVTHDNAKPERIHVTGFGIDRTRFNPAVNGQSIRDRYDIADDTVLIFALQRLELRKGVDVLLRALAEVSKEDVHLLIGGKGRDGEQVQHLVAELNISDRVTFAGFVDEAEKPLYYAAADIFALHSHHEGLGIVLAEAAACGKPLVTTHAGGTTDIALHGQTGLTVPPDDPSALASALRTLIINPEQRSIMGNAAARHADHFDIKQVAARYLTLFEQCQQNT
jgi:phosphatidylinositol alpha-1,6-mannosyltransferase